MLGYKSKYTGREIERKLDKIDISNFTGKFTDDSTEADWNCVLNGKQQVSLNINSVTKEFKEAIDLKINTTLTSFEKLFYNNEKLEKIKIFDISNITNISYMFGNCLSLNTVDLSNFDTSKLTTMNCMFYNCPTLTTVDLSNFDTSKIKLMHGMFYNCSSLITLDLSSFDTSIVNNMTGIFEDCSSLTTLDLSNFDTSKLIAVNNMFLNCSSLTTLDLSNFDISKVTNMLGMFENCSSLSYIKCTQAFKNWCIKNKQFIKLSEHNLTWDIVDAA